MVRLNKYIASCGVCSRRRAEEYILNGDVSINGVKTTNLSTIIDEENDVVTLLGKKLEIKQEYLYIMLNKPKGYITTNKEQFNRKCTLDLIHEKTRVFPIGRLDMNTEGLLLFTNDGDFANKLMHPRNKMEKTYIVTTNTKITDKMVADLKR